MNFAQNTIQSENKTWSDANFGQPLYQNTNKLPKNIKQHVKSLNFE